MWKKRRIKLLTVRKSVLLNTPLYSYVFAGVILWWKLPITDICAGGNDAMDFRLGLLKTQDIRRVGIWSLKRGLCMSP